MGEIITMINTTRAIILTITTIITAIVVRYEEKSVRFMAKKIVTLISLQTINNRKQKNFEDKIENFVKIRVNTIHFWLIIKEIQMMTLMMSIKKQIIQTIIMKIVYNML